MSATDMVTLSDCYLVAGTVSCRSPSWWTVAAPMVQSEPVLSPLMLRAMHILLTLLQLRLPAAWKSMQLSVVMLWNAAVQSGAVMAGCVLGKWHCNKTP